MKKLVFFMVLLGTSAFCLGQETTASLSGTVKDPSGAVVPHAKVSATTPTLVGVKETVTDAKGQYHFTNLPPGSYVITVDQPGFKTLKRGGLFLEVGHSPTVDLTLSVGSAADQVDVNTETPQIDVTTVTTQTNIDQQVLNNVPHGRSFQSVIQFAPAASNEPLMGNTSTNGSGSGSPGGQSNGNAFGYSVAGGADTENSYLVEGQETANLIGGYSHTNVPVDFIGEVQVKSSGIEAEHGGSLGGVVNVIMQKGSSTYHGTVGVQFEDQSFDASPSAYLRYNPSTQPTGVGVSPVSAQLQAEGITSGPSPLVYIDQSTQSYTPVKDHYSTVQPGFTLGGPLLPFGSLRDKLFFFVGFQPQLDRDERHVNYGFTSYGNVPFSQNTNTYYTTARVDAQVTKKIRVFGSYLYQLQKQYGESMPNQDSIEGELNTSTFNAPIQFTHSQGYTAPNITVNTGADITISNHIVSTTRFGYYFENYHDIGYSNSGDGFIWETDGLAADGATDAFGKPLPAPLQQGQGASSQATVFETFFNANKAIQLDQTLEIYKTGWFGTHNFKGGYQLHRLSNLLAQAYNIPIVFLYVGNTAYTTQTTAGPANCAALAAKDGTPISTSNGTATCQGKYGYVEGYDYGDGGTAISYNHSLFIQDSWTVGHGLTFDLGVRVEKEYLPGEASGAGVPANPISFGWGQKIAPRIGAAWDVFQNGKMKLFGDYGVFNDQMKLNLAISSFGGEYWNSCYYGNDDPALTNINFAYNGSKRFCQGGPSQGANFGGGGTTPTGLTFLENVNFRAAVVTCATCNPYEEAVQPNLQPYRQHESTAGFDYQVSPLVSFEARYDRRRLDHVIEDSSIFNPALGGETFVIVNPGQGANSTFTGFCNFLYSIGTNPCTSSSGLYPPNQTIPAARSYDGLELRLNKAMANHWYGMVSYTYSHFRGNYTGLTSSDQADGGGGRVSPNNNRSFDEPYFSYNDAGGSSSGLLPTDRPNKVKGYAYYELKYAQRFASDFGLFGYVYQGSPITSYLQDVGDPGGYDFPVDVFNRGKWANISQDPGTGAITVGNVRTYRTPRFSQFDLNFNQQVKLSGSKALTFSVTGTNAFNFHAVTAVTETIDSQSAYVNQVQAFAIPGALTKGGTPTPLTVGDGVPWYATVMHPYDLVGLLNANAASQASTSAVPANSPLATTPPPNAAIAAYSAPQTISAMYGQPNRYQLPRTVRLGFKFSF
jgi:hypothetical protein